MRILTTVADGGRVHLASAERGAPDEGRPVCSPVAHPMAAVAGVVDCRRCRRLFDEARLPTADAPVAVASPVPIGHPANIAPAPGSVVHAHVDVIGGSVRGRLVVLEVCDLRPHDIPDVLLSVESERIADQLRESGQPMHGRLMDLRRVAGYGERCDLRGSGHVYSPATGVPIGIEVGAEALAPWSVHDCMTDEASGIPHCDAGGDPGPVMPGIDTRCAVCGASWIVAESAGFVHWRPLAAWQADWTRRRALVRS